MHSWKDYNIFDCNKNLTQAWGDVTKECMNGIWKQTFKRFLCDFRGFAKHEEVAKINKMWLRWQTTLTYLDKDDIEQLLKVPE